ncbi:MAG: AMP-binding protein [Proteobacteria bacterium]|nr:AMP-binding protein [Pseudomonadota bacterium]
MDQPWLKEYQEGIPTEIDTMDYKSLVDLLDVTNTKYGDRPAFANMGRTLNFSDIERKSFEMAAYLQQFLQLDQGDKVAIMMPNLLQYPIALFGILRAGLVVVNVNPLYTPRELKHQLVDSGAKAIIILEHFANTLAQVIAETDVKHVVTTEVGDLLKFPKSKIVNFVLRYVKKAIPTWHIPHTQNFNAALAEGAKMNFEPVNIKLEDIAFLQYTGGTTGVSKGAILTHKNILYNVMQCKNWVSSSLYESVEVGITALPLYHIFSLTANCFYFVAIGGVSVLITNPRDMPAFVKELANWEFSFITGVNTLFGGLLNTPGFEQLDFSKLKVTLGGGMAVTKAVAEKWKKVTGKLLLEAYGLSETSPAVCINPVYLEDYNGCIGLPIASTQVKIIDDQENDLPIDEPGELCVKGPQVTSGYWNRPDETEKLFTKDGWLKTGDIAAMDKKGFFRIMDRKKDMIIVSGFNVFPNEVEDVIGMHPGVLEVAAIGIPDEKSGEIVKVFIVKSDPALTEESVFEHCKENLTGYKRPKQITFLDELPKTNVGKILRRELRDV